MSAPRSNLLSSSQRAGYGFIATVRERATGSTLSRVYKGGSSFRALVGQLADDCDREGWMVVVVSTPETILRDLDPLVHDERERKEKRSPESRYLRMVGRVDLVEAQPLYDRTENAHRRRPRT